MKRNGFTLIELLVVISIIALLLAIMMPALGLVKEKARGVVGRTNLKTLYLSSRLYAEDYNGKLPSQYTEPDAAGNRRLCVWVKQLAPYIENMDEARYCPSAKTKPDPADANEGMIYGTSMESWMWNNDGTTDEPEYGSFGMNGWLYSDNLTSKHFRNITTISQGSAVPVFADSKWVDGWPESDHYIAEDAQLDDDTLYSNGNMIRFVMDRHGKTTNLVFADGHAQSVALSEMWSIKWHQGFKTRRNVRRGADFNGSPIYRKR